MALKSPLYYKGIKGSVTEESLPASGKKTIQGIRIAQRFDPGKIMLYGLEDCVYIGRYQKVEFSAVHLIDVNAIGLQQVHIGFKPDVTQLT